MKGPKSQTINQDTERHNLQGITRKYQLYPVVFLAYVFVSAGLIFGKFFILKNFIKDVGYTSDQIFFSTKVTPRLQVTANIAIDMTLGLNTTIRNMPMLEQFNKEIYQLQQTTHDIADALKERDQTYDPVIQAILFDNACDYRTPSTVTVDNYCKQLKQISQEMGLIAHMTNYQTILINFQDVYDRSNKSTESLNAIDIETQPSRMQTMLLLANILDVITNRLDDNFSDILDQGDLHRSLINYILTFSLIITALLLHTRLIKRLKESENRFRDVLKIFPARVVLSNFMLKSYLTRTCKGSLESSVMQVN